MILATVNVPRDATAQTNASAALSADEVFGKGLEALKRKDYPNAVILLHQAADRGDVRAQGLLGAMYLNGEVLKQDYAQALVWLSKSAEQGSAEAPA